MTLDWDVALLVSLLATAAYVALAIAVWRTRDGAGWRVFCWATTFKAVYFAAWWLDVLLVPGPYQRMHGLTAVIYAAVLAAAALDAALARALLRTSRARRGGES